MVSMIFDERSTHIIANTAMSYYHGEVSSSEAFAQMDRALLSWNYDPRMLNASRELFDLVVDTAIDYDLMAQARDPQLRGAGIGHWTDADWNRLKADLDRF